MTRNLAEMNFIVHSALQQPHTNSELNRHEASALNAARVNVDTLIAIGHPQILLCSQEESIGLCLENSSVCSIGPGL